MTNASRALRAIGFWVDDDRLDLPDPNLLIDVSWETDERQTVGNYLSANQPTAAGEGCSPCRVCGIPNGFEEFTDGVYLWPEGLAHYVNDHAVRLPADFVDHAMRPSGGNDVELVVRSQQIDFGWWTETCQT